MATTTTRRQEASDETQLGSRPTDTRQTNRHEAKRPSDQAFIYVVGYIGLSRLFLVSYKARGHDETSPRQQSRRHEVMRPKVTDLQSQKVIVVVSRAEKQKGVDW